MIGEDFDGLDKRPTSGVDDGIVDGVGLSALVNGASVSIRENL
jgi:hypothetical protein